MTKIPTNLHDIIAHAAIGDKIILRGKWKRVGRYWMEGGFEIEVVAYCNDYFYAKTRKGKRVRLEYYLRARGVITSQPYYTFAALLAWFKRLPNSERLVHAN